MFLQSAFLIGLAAVLVPVLVHLLSRQQVTRVEMGTTRFLYEILSDTSRRRRIRRWLLLATRMAILGLVAMMFARPSIPTYEDMLGGALRIVLIDRSGSMQSPGQNGRALDDALAAAREEVSRFGKNTTVLWAAFDSHVDAIASTAGQAPRVAAKAAADTDYAEALSWARDQAAAEKRSHAQVLLFTDLQMTGLAGEREPGSELLPADVPIRIMDVGRREIQNVAVQSIEPRYVDQPGESALSVAATIFNFGTAAVEDLPASIHATNGSQSLRLKKTIDIAPSQASEVLFDFGRVPPGLWQLTVDVDIADDLSFDNRRLSAIEFAHPDRILVIDTGKADQPQSSSGYYVTLALNAVVQAEKLDDTSAVEDTNDPNSNTAIAASLNGQFAARQWFVQESGEPNLKSIAPALVVVSDAAELSTSLVAQLEEFVSAGGRLLVFAGSGSNVNSLTSWQDSPLKPGKLLQSENASTMPFRITDIAANSTMLEPFLDPQQGDLSRLAFTSLLSVDIAHSDRVLASFDGQRPAITQHSVSKGRVAWFMASADDRSGNWTTSPLYLPLVRQMAADLLGRTGEGTIRFRNVGDGLPEAYQPADKDHPSGKKNVPENDSGESLYFNQPGFVRTAEDQPLYVVNPAIKESDPTRIAAADLAQQLGLKLLEEDPKTEVSQSTTTYHELWPYLAATLITLIVLEFALANRTSA